MDSMQCISCKHYKGLHRCEAYSEGIPIQIFTGEHDHTNPFEGDNGVRFEPIEDVE